MRGQPNFSDDSDPTREQRPTDHGSQLFNAEEMQAIRDQYEERLAAEMERREELEWQVRRALAAIRDAEVDARKASENMNGVYSSLAALLSPAEATPGPAPTRAQPARSSYSPARPATKAPPPLPPLPTKTTGSSVRRGPLPPRDLPGYRRLVA